MYIWLWAPYYERRQVTLGGRQSPKTWFQVDIWTVFLWQISNPKLYFRGRSHSSQTYLKFLVQMNDLPRLSREFLQVLFYWAPWFIMLLIRGPYIKSSNSTPPYLISSLHQWTMVHKIYCHFSSMYSYCFLFNFYHQGHMISIVLTIRLQKIFTSTL